MANDPMPYFIGASTQSLMQDFDSDIYNVSPSSLIYKFVDALCGSTGAGQLLNLNFLNTLQGDLATMYGSDLDYFFGNIGFLPRVPSEMYIANAATDLLTSAEWDDIKVKDAWYAARIKDFWKACSMGGTPEAIRLICQAACSCDCNVYEDWRYKDNLGLTNPVGRADARNEVVVQPLKSELSPQEAKLLRDMLARVMGVGTVVTVNTLGLAVLDPVPIAAAASDSTYFEVQRRIKAHPILRQFPPPVLLTFNLNRRERWLFDAFEDHVLAPHAMFGMTAHYSTYYLVGGGKQSPIDSVTYGIIPADSTDGTVVDVSSYVQYQTTAQFTPWTSWAKADSPDNYPGGQGGIHPSFAPALNSDGTPYSFPWASQDDYVVAQIIQVTSLGGNANDQQYQLLIQAPYQSGTIFLAEYAVAYSPPGRDSTVSASLTYARQLIDASTTGNTDTRGFVRS